MKPLLIYGDLDASGGIATYNNYLIRELENNGHQVELFSRNPDSSFFQKKVFLPFAYSKKIFELYLKLNSIDPDIVHINESLTWFSIIRGISLINVIKNQDYPVLYFFRGWRWSLFERIKNNRSFKNFFTNNFEKIDKILVLSQDFKDALVVLGIDEEKIVVSTIMVESDKYRPKEKNFDKPYRILFCARMVEGKGPFELLEAASLVLEKYPQTEFIFMGDGPCLEDLKNKAGKMNIEDNVVFTGYKTGEDKIEWYKKSDLFVLPSYTEGFPNVFLEAMASGLPVIAILSKG